MKIIDSASLEGAVADAARTFKESPFWRGHADASWTLQPHVFRSIVAADGSRVKYKEHSLLHHFVMRGASRVQRHPAYTDQYGWLMLAQHYGLPTRLLDWSYSPLVALFFAVENTSHDTADGCLWALYASGFNKQQMGFAHLPNVDADSVQAIIKDAFLGSAGEPKACAMSAQETDLRMLVQHSTITVHGDETPLEELTFTADTLIRFIVPSATKPHIRNLLAAFGISHSALFPDLAGLAAELKGTTFTS